MIITVKKITALFLFTTISAAALAQTAQSDAMRVPAPEENAVSANSISYLSEEKLNNAQDRGQWFLGAGHYAGLDRVSLGYSSSPVWRHEFNGSTLKLNLEYELAYWHGRGYTGDARAANAPNSMWQASINPMLNWYLTNKFYLQAGIGATYFSNNYATGKEFGSRFNFSDNLGIGYHFTPNTSLTYRISHYSNAGIKKPNPGVNMQQLILKTTF